MSINVTLFYLQSGEECKWMNAKYQLFGLNESLSNSEYHSDGV